MSALLTFPNDDDLDPGLETGLAETDLGMVLEMDLDPESLLAAADSKAAGLLGGRYLADAGWMLSNAAKLGGTSVCWS